MSFVCENCNGKGWVLHPWWKDFWETYGVYPEVDPLDEWQKQMGYDGKLPPEEILCPICKGYGEFDDEIVKVFYETSKGSNYISFKDFLTIIEKLNFLSNKSIEV